MPTFRNTLSVLSSQAGVCRMTKFKKSWGSQREKFWLENSLNYLLFNRTYPYFVTLLTIGSGYYRAKTSPVGYPNYSQIQSFYTYLPMNMEQTRCSETSAYKIQTPGNYPEENIQHREKGKSLKSRILTFTFQICFSQFLSILIFPNHIGYTLLMLKLLLLDIIKIQFDAGIRTAF